MNQITTVWLGQVKNYLVKQLPGPLHPIKLEGNGNFTQPSVPFCTPRKFDTETEREFICLERKGCCRARNAEAFSQVLPFYGLCAGQRHA